MQSAGRRPSKMPSSTAANIVFERRKASMRSMMLLDVADVVIAEWRDLLAAIQQGTRNAFMDDTDWDSGNAAACRSGE